MGHKFSKTAIAALLGGTFIPVSSYALDLTGHSLELKSRMVQFEVETQQKTSNSAYVITGKKDEFFRQSALGLQLEYKSPYFGDLVGVDLAGYQVTRLGQSAAEKNEMLPYALGSNTQTVSSWSALGQASIKLKYEDVFAARLGRQTHSSLLLKSTYSRAVEDAFNGYSFSITPANGLKLYGAQYGSWMPRSGDKFVKLGTEEGPSSAGQVTRVIDGITILGAQYRNERFQVDVESLNSKNYLQKYGAIGAYTLPLTGKDSLKFSVGASTSADDGALFTCASTATPEKELDKGSCKNSGQGVYLALDWKTGNISLTGAVAKFRGLWIEDNFAGSNPAKKGSLIQDHGTNFFPTGSTSGNDMTNDGELARMVRLGYDWKQYLPGLQTGIGYKFGTGARNNHLASRGSAKESEKEFDVRYAVPLLKGLNARYSYLEYSADRVGSINAIEQGGSKDYRKDHRIYLDYSYRFF